MPCRGDLNGHVGQNNHVISRIHGGYGYDERNAEGERIVDFAVSKDMEEKMQGPKRIKWFKLKEIELCRQFKEKVLEELTHEIGDVDEWWNRTMEIILRVAREILGESSGKMFENKETWWFSEEVKDATKQKREAKKRWEGTQMEED
ncbi:uncharacterized protein LOC135215843 [Macrobrachium nipponense]|uniref:uncharacterized protein LOC135215843 n=1 Tax=Macrobrachium nipponense TaxID=159736 RepID=UPI0030C8B94D